MYILESMTKPIYIRRNNQSIKLLSFYFDPTVIESVGEKFIALSSTIKRIPKPLRKYKIQHHE